MSNPDRQRTKKRVASHIAESDSLKVVKGVIPSHWVIRDYRPDYGLDLSIEVFRKIEGEQDSETLGEHFFVQVKGVRNARMSQYRIKARYNVEKRPLRQEEEIENIVVIRHVLDTPFLSTVQRMSSSVPVFLFVVDMSSETVYYVNINDYIDKVVLPGDPEYWKKKTKTVYVPAENILERGSDSISVMRFYAKRPKLYALFNKATYQQHELDYTPDHELIGQARHFAKVLMAIDIWGETGLWNRLDYCGERLRRFVAGDRISDLDLIGEQIVKSSVFDAPWESPYSAGRAYSYRELAHFDEVRRLWDVMKNLYNSYEEFCREWYLPTMINAARKMDLLEAFKVHSRSRRRA